MKVVILILLITGSLLFISLPQKTIVPDSSPTQYSSADDDTTTNSDEIIDDGGNYIQSDSFHGYPCTEDCSGHEAGYDWAEENGIEDPNNCGGNSDSFIEGCMSYAEENYGNYSGNYADEY